MLYSSKLDTVHIIKTMKIILKISNKILVTVIFTFVLRSLVRQRDILSQVHADIVGIKHWLEAVIGEGTDLTPVK